MYSGSYEAADYRNLAEFMASSDRGQLKHFVLDTAFTQLQAWYCRVKKTYIAHCLVLFCDGKKDKCLCNIQIRAYRHEYAFTGINSMQCVQSHGVQISCIIRQNHLRLKVCVAQATERQLEYPSDAAQTGPEEAGRQRHAEGNQAMEVDMSLTGSPQVRNYSTPGNVSQDVRNQRY